MSGYLWKFNFSPEYFSNLREAYTIQTAIGDLGSFTLVVYLLLNIVAAFVRVAHFRYNVVTKNMKVRLADHEKN